MVSVFIHYSYLRLRRLRFYGQIWRSNPVPSMAFTGDPFRGPPPASVDRTRGGPGAGPAAATTPDRHPSAGSRGTPPGHRSDGPDDRSGVGDRPAGGRLEVRFPPLLQRLDDRLQRLAVPG